MGTAVFQASRVSRSSALNISTRVCTKSLTSSLISAMIAARFLVWFSAYLVSFIAAGPPTPEKDTGDKVGACDPGDEMKWIFVDHQTSTSPGSSRQFLRLPLTAFVRISNARLHAHVGG